MLNINLLMCFSKALSFSLQALKVHKLFTCSIVVALYVIVFCLCDEYDRRV